MSVRTPDGYPLRWIIGIPCDDNRQIGQAVFVESLVIADRVVRFAVYDLYVGAFPGIEPPSLVVQIDDVLCPIDEDRGPSPPRKGRLPSRPGVGRDKIRMDRGAAGLHVESVNSDRPEVTVVAGISCAVVLFGTVLRVACSRAGGMTWCAGLVYGRG